MTTDLSFAQQKQRRPAGGSGNLWQRLTEPPASIQAPDRRRQARLLSSLLLFLTLLGAGVGLGLPLASMVSGQGFLVSPVAAPAIIILAISYSLSRTRYYMLATVLTVIVPSVAVMAIPVFNLPSSTDVPVLYFTCLSLLLGSIMLSMQVAAILSTIIFAAMLLVVMYVPGVAGPDGFYMLGFNAMVAVLFLVAMRHRDLLEADRQAELRKVNVALEASAKEARAATALAREASRLKSEFMATMSHELRTPLNAIIGFTEIMLAGMGGTLNDDAAHMTQRVHANSERLLSLINDVLDLAKIEARRLEVVYQPFSLRQLVESLQGQMASLAEQKALDFEVYVSPDLPPTLRGDDALIERIITNLLSNAFKFTKYGSVKLSADTNGDDGTWTIAVTDTGIGIPPHAMEYIFDAFRQVDSSSQRAYGGSGLGLTIAQELALAMDGSIRVESAVGQGSTFTVTLPLLVAGEPTKGNERS